jgi:hypothetical protein
MLSLTLTQCQAKTGTTVAGKKKMRKRLRKFGRKLADERRDDLRRMAEKIAEICREEERRSKELYREHREFFDDDDYHFDPSKSIDFFEP